MELTVYLVYVLNSINAYLKTIKIAGFLFILSSIIFMATVRQIKFDADILVYVERMKADAIIGAYYFREPLLWFSHNFLYKIFSNEYVVLFITDSILIVLIYFGIMKRSAHKFYGYTFMFFFPVILGFQNIYRQLFAELILIQILALGSNAIFKKSAIILLSTLTHNSSALFSSLIVTRIKIGPWSILVLFASLVAISIGLFSFSGTKGSANTGLELSFLYVFVTFFFSSVLLYYHKRLETLRHQPETLLNVREIISIQFILFISLFLLSSGLSERVSMFGLVLMYPSLTHLERLFRQKVFFRIVFGLMGFLIIFISEAGDFILK